MQLSKIITIAGIACLLTACEKGLPLYDDPQAYLNFYYYNAADSTLSYSFVYNDGGEKDSVWLTVTTMGFVSNTDRPFRLRQISTGTRDAIPGKHYVDFHDTDYQRLLFIPAGEVAVQIPIIVLHDTSLAEGNVTLKVAIDTNDTFLSGYPEQAVKLITISDQIVKPQRWGPLMDFIFGDYGTEKHRFMIAHSNFKWDDDFLKSINVTLYYADDQSFLRYMCNKFARELRTENERRQAEGLPLLTEADGTMISFKLYN